jgi:hypothetical protein
MANQYHSHPLIDAVYKLALAEQYQPPASFDPFTASSDEHVSQLAAADAHNERFIKPQTAHVFRLMEEHKMNHPKKAKQQYDRGLITASDYAGILGEHLLHS